jgi:outer membrane immunogenic protein
MKRLLASASILALSSVAVSAADLPMKAAPYIAPIPVFSWTGCYIGAHVGGGTSHDSFTSDNSWFLDNFSSDSSTGKGAVAGGQIGCNYQDGNAVFGLEGEGYWSGIKASGGWRDLSTTGEGASFAATSKNKDDFSIAVRFGWAFDRTMVYGKAGWVWGNFAFDSAQAFCSTCGLSNVFHSSGTLDGLLLGVGLEHAFTRNWTVKLEYNFLDFGSKGLNFTQLDCPTCTLESGTNSNHSQKHIFKVGFNYLFNVWGAPPVVAKY